MCVVMAADDELLSVPSLASGHHQKDSEGEIAGIEPNLRYVRARKHHIANARGSC
jgi:hypothetical protein